MNKKKRYIVFLLLSIILAIALERAIPHTHIEVNGTVVADWDVSNDKEPHKEHESEMLHSTFYQPTSFNYSFEIANFSQQLFKIFVEKQIENPPTIPNYNIIPQQLNSILFVVHLYSSKAPPFYC